MSLALVITGDVITLALLTVIGVAAHGEVGLSVLPRLGLTFAALAVGWFALAPAFGLLNGKRAGPAHQLWRPALAGLFAAQLAVNLRGLILDGGIQPLFAVVLGVTTALGMLAWRALAIWLAGR